MRVAFYERFAMQAVLFEITPFISVVFINSLLIVLSPFSFVLLYIKFRAKIRIFAMSSSRQLQTGIPTAFSNFQKQFFRIEFCYSQNPRNQKKRHPLMFSLYLIQSHIKRCLLMKQQLLACFILANIFNCLFHFFIRIP